MVMLILEIAPRRMQTAKQKVEYSENKRWSSAFSGSYLDFLFIFIQYLGCQDFGFIGLAVRFIRF